ncbi:uncharacterized protein [Chelonus insularis]|uniref:uncharacterized protein n=1 Tax=Chelonus insularis TaxID=460826 RepID=UPI00158CFEF4|nr:uncharacterized protein LOC118065243 [Chelonus insularis]
MQKKFNFSFKQSSVNLINQIMSKLNMSKQEAHTHTQNEETNNSKEENKEHYPLKISSENIAAVCDQLEKFINYMQNTIKFEYYIQNYSIDLEKRLKNNAEEIEQMLKEIKSIYVNIQKQKKQQKCLNKEKLSIDKTLKKLKNEEIREMELIISLFEKELYNRWESIKSTRKPETLNGLLTDIRSKQLALINLETLISRKLINLEKFPVSSNLTDDFQNKLESTSMMLPLLPLELDSLENVTVPPPPPPLPSITPLIPSLMSSLTPLPINDSNIFSI